MNRNILKLLLVLIILIPLSSARTPITYRVDVDQDYGFYKIRTLDSNQSNQSISYVNNTLNISVGDTIIWMNDATPDEELTIISDQNLWENDSARLRWNYQKFNYTFTEPGIYTFHVKEDSRLEPQKIIVNTIIPTPTAYAPTPNTKISISTPTATPISSTSTKITMTSVTPNKTPGFTIFIGLVAILYVLIIRKL